MERTICCILTVDKTRAKPDTKPASLTGTKSGENINRFRVFLKNVQSVVEIKSDKGCFQNKNK